MKKDNSKKSCKAHGGHTKSFAKPDPNTNKIVLLIYTNNSVLITKTTKTYLHRRLFCTVSLQLKHIKGDIIRSDQHVPWYAQDLD